MANWWPCARGCPYMLKGPVISPSKPIFAILILSAACEDVRPNPAKTNTAARTNVIHFLFISEPPFFAARGQRDVWYGKYVLFATICKYQRTPGMSRGNETKGSAL